MATILRHVSRLIVCRRAQRDARSVIPSKSFKNSLTAILRMCSTAADNQQPALGPGFEDFREYVDNDVKFVDKSAFIKEILDDRHIKNILIARPRRFGKSLNLSMLHYFLAPEVEGLPTRDLFDNLKIAQLGRQYMRHQGKYPVIYVSFQGVRGNTYEDSFSRFKETIKSAFAAHMYLLESPALRDVDKQYFNAILKDEANKVAFEDAIQKLTRYLYLHHKTKPWFLCDEYDTPLQCAYAKGYYNSMLETMRACFSGALKTNKFVCRAVIVGILRIAKESLFTGLNNIQVFTMLQPKYAEHFGFTEREVVQLLQEAALQDRIEEVRKWYNGYRVGSTVLYNPWSVAEYISSNGRPDHYWLNTSDNSWIEGLLTSKNSEVKDDLLQLLKDQSIEVFLDQHTAFGNLRTEATAVWSLLFLTGYLKVEDSSLVEGQGWKYSVCIPNEEIRLCYNHIVQRWLADGHSTKWVLGFLNDLLTGKIELFKESLKDILEGVAGVHDVAKNNSEAFYHGLMLGLTANLHRNSNYVLKSNKESGFGRYDLLIFSRDPGRPAILMELKETEIGKGKRPTEIAALLQAEAVDALKQINEKKYFLEAQALQKDRVNIYQIGLAFHGKRFELVYEHITSARE
jgi:hypothetical protein